MPARRMTVDMSIFTNSRQKSVTIATSLEQSRKKGLIDHAQLVPAHVAEWSTQRTRAPCAVERDEFRNRGSNLSPDASAYQRIISNNSYAHDEQEECRAVESGFDGVLCT